MKESRHTVYNGFGRDYMKAAMIATGGLSGGISSTIAGGNFWDGFRQGIITSGLNHVAHLGAAALQKGSAVKVYDSDGDYIGKIKVKNYRAYSASNGNPGLEIELVFTSASTKYSNYEWIQTVFTNDPRVGSGYSVYNDPQPGDDQSPYYYTKQDYINNPAIKNGNQYTFYDGPNRYAKNFNIGWRGELSLVGINKTGAHALHTFKYGFNLYPNNHILVMPLYDIEYKNRYKWLKK